MLEEDSSLNEELDKYLEYDDFQADQRGKSQILPSVKNRSDLLDSLRQAWKILDRNDLEWLEKFLDRIPEVTNATSQFCKDTLLHIAAKKGNANQVKLLLNRGADISALNEVEKTPFEVAKSDKVKDVFIEFAKEKNFKYNLYKSGRLPIPEDVEKMERLRQFKENKILMKKQQKLSENTKIASENNEDWKNCDICGDEVAPTSPFLYLDKLFCSQDCLQSFKIKN